MWRILTTIAFERSWWASSSFTANLAILWESTFWRTDHSEFLHRLLGISLKPKPRRNAPVTSPKVFEQAMATASTFPILLRKMENHEISEQFSHKAKKKKCQWFILLFITLQESASIPRPTWLVNNKIIWTCKVW